MHFPLRSLKLLLFACLFCVFITARTEAASSGALSISDSVQTQLSTLVREKAGRTSTQKKMNSQLLYAIRQRAGDPLFTKVPALTSSVTISDRDMVLVDIKADVTDTLLAEIESAGAEIVNHHSRFNAIPAKVPYTAIETLAGKESISRIRSADRAMHNKTNTSEGVAAHAADQARKTYGYTGRGVKVGVLSDSVDYLSDVQATGDLPAVTVLKDAPGNAGEGTAMLEIVHDLAPDADLYFATAWDGMADFAAQIIALADAGCRVIVDDITYFAESPFQDDILSQAVNTVTDRGVFYFSSAGNSGNLNDGESGVWEGDYNGINYDGLKIPCESIHDFGNNEPFNTITDTCGVVTLHWADPLGGSSNDYDLYLIDATGTSIVAVSNDFQDGDDDPIEGFFYGDDLNGYQLLIALYSGEARFLNLSTHRGRLAYGTDGQTRGHSCTVDGFGVAAVSANQQTEAFTGTESVEFFTSDGPRRVFFEANGTPITAGNFLAATGGGEIRKKPDVTAADGVETATPGFNPFYGTSAAAPHAAAIAALMLQAHPGLTIAEGRTVFEQTAHDIEDAGWDRDSGVGIIMADTALEYICGNYGCAPVSPFPPAILNLLLN
jgi:subtilisin family serine protease